MPSQHEKWSDRCRQQFVSQPFEKNIVAKMRGAGMEAGPVEHGTAKWNTGQATTVLTAPKALPGEIDCLAVNDLTKTVSVLECKVLDEPISLKKAEARHARLTSDSTKGFQKKLAKKAAWIRSLPCFNSYDIVAKIVVDRPVGEMFDRSYPNGIVSAEFIPDFIDKVPSPTEHREILSRAAKAFTT